MDFGHKHQSEWVTSNYSQCLEDHSSQSFHIVASNKELLDMIATK